MVSIIVPVYNSEDYIAQTIESLLNQDYKKIEIIIIDDGSSDLTKEIVMDYQRTDDRLSYYYQNNAGAPVARNNGLRKAAGEYVIFFDADDLMNPTAISIFMEETKLDEYDMLIGDYQHIIDNNFEDKSALNLKLNNYSDEKDDCFLREISFVGPTPGNKMFKRSFLLLHKLKYEDIRIGQDLNFFLKVIVKYPKVKVVRETVFYYRIHDGSITQSYNDSILDIIKSLENIELERSRFFLNNPDVLETLKFNHYTYQLIKIPKINNKVLRKKCYNILIKELMKLQKENLIKNKITKYHMISRIIKYCGSFYTSNILSKIIVKSNL